MWQGMERRDNKVNLIKCNESQFCPIQVLPFHFGMNYFPLKLKLNVTKEKFTSTVCLIKSNNKRQLVNTKLTCNKLLRTYQKQVLAQK